MGRGGANRGQGRKPTPQNLKRVHVNIRLPQWLADWLKKHKDQGKIIEESLVEKYKLEGPKKP